jgi:hypothetical protein
MVAVRHFTFFGAIARLRIWNFPQSHFVRFLPVAVGSMRLESKILRENTVFLQKWMSGSNLSCIITFIFCRFSKGFIVSLTSLDQPNLPPPSACLLCPSALEVIFGRQACCDFVMCSSDSRRISKQHAKARLSDAGNAVEFLDTSTFGTFIFRENEWKKMTKNVPFVLQNGDKIKFLEFQFQVSLEVFKLTRWSELLI